MADQRDDDAEPPGVGPDAEVDETVAESVEGQDDIDPMRAADEADERELADALAPPSLPPGSMVLGLLLLACSALPLTPSGASFLRVLASAFLRSPLEGVMTLIGFGSPFLFGLLVALAAWSGSSRWVAPATIQRLLVTNTSTMHAQLVLVAFLLWRDGVGMMPGALLGFAIVSGGLFTFEHARQSAAAGGIDDRGVRIEGEGPSVRWLIRWTATMIVALCGWLRLQLLADVAFGWAVEAALAVCVAISLLVMRRRP